MHLLYVDDDRINLMLFENACATLHGLQLSTASSSAEALELVREQPPQLLVIDLHLPDGDGTELLAALRRDVGLSQVPAVLCSADEGEVLRQRAADAGFAACWTKPVDGRSLRQGLSALGFALPTS
jgi:two-component system OmpR family response regulator